MSTESDLSSSAGAAVARALGISETLANCASETWSKLLDSKAFTIADGLAADALYRLQCIRRITFIAEIREELERRGVEPRALPEGFALQAIDGGACADGPDVRRMWMNLTIDAVSHNGRAHPFHIETLRRMTAAEKARLRDFLIGWPRKLAAADSVSQRLLALQLLEPAHVSMVLGDMERGHARASWMGWELWTAVRDPGEEPSSITIEEFTTRRRVEDAE